MKRDQIKKESKHWVEHHIITEDQREQIVERYPRRQSHPILLTFAALFIGLGFLTFIASNWSQISDLSRMAILLGFLIVFYMVGEWVYRKRSKSVGLNLILVALFIFGAGIFLTGQMYHYMSFSAFSFLIWSLAAFSIYLLFHDRCLFIVTLVIITSGQVYSGVVYQEFNLWMGCLFLIGCGAAIYYVKDHLSSVLFGFSYTVQAVVLVFSEGVPYYWLLSLFLVLYLLDDFLFEKGRIRSFKSLSIIAILILNVAQVFVLDHAYISERFEDSFFFFIVWAILFVYAVIRSAESSTNYYWIDLILFVPVFKFATGDILSLAVLFIYSLCWLIAGYNQEVTRWINKGAIVFLLATFITYIQLAWDFMDRSLFFFFGGILLFILSFFLERKRRQIQKGGAPS